jgi:DNA-binding NarL/FixJ family response regulator
MLKIILVDDHKIFREGIKAMLSGEGIAEIIGDFGNGKKFLEFLPNLQPDLILMDISMPVLDGIEATKKAMEINPDFKIIVLTSFGDEKYYYKMIEAGVKGFLLKSTDIDELEKAILEVSEGGVWFSNKLLQKIITSINKNKEINFSDREIEILKFICEGLTNEQIAKKINLSYDTVRWHRSNLLSKTNCSNTASLVMFAIKNRIIEV